MSKIQRKFVNFKKNSKEDGFSLIDVVITVAIVVALSITGFITYTGLIMNAKIAATATSATEVYSAVLTYENDGMSETTIQTAIDDFNNTAKDVKVYSHRTADEISVIAVHKDAFEDSVFPVDYAAALAAKTGPKADLIQVR